MQFFFLSGSSTHSRIETNINRTKAVAELFGENQFKQLIICWVTDTSCNIKLSGGTWLQKHAISDSYQFILAEKEALPSHSFYVKFINENDNDIKGFFKSFPINVYLFARLFHAIFSKKRMS